MNSTGEPRSVGQAMKRGLKALWAGVVSAFFILLMLVFWGASISSCLTGQDWGGGKDGKKLSIIEVNDKNARHVKIEHALQSVWIGATDAREGPKVVIAD